jgi:hypothetical protein
VEGAWLLFPMVDWAAVEEDQDEQTLDETDARLAARLRQILETPGISDKDRKLVERNLQRLLKR